MVGELQIEPACLRRRKTCFVAPGNVLRKLRPCAVSAAISPTFQYRTTSSDPIPPILARGRRRPCRNSQCRPILVHGASTFSRGSRNNFRRPLRFGRSREARSHRRLMLEARLQGPLIRARSRIRRGTRSSSHNRGTHTNSCNQQDASRSGASRRHTNNVRKLGCSLATPPHTWQLQRIC